MIEYGKIFVKKENNNIETDLKPYDPNSEKYYDVINNARSYNYKQVIVNSEIMIKLMHNFIKNGGTIQKVNMSDSTDDDIQYNVKSTVKKLKNNNLYFIDLKEELEWASESNSIDIFSIDLIINRKQISIKSNGILAGNELNTIFLNFIKNELESYLKNDS